MFKFKFKHVNYLYNVAVLLILFAFAGMPAVYAVPSAAAGGLVTGTFLNTVKMQGLSLMAVQVEIWEKDIEEAIFKDNAFITFAFRADEYVNGRAVHIPQSGGAGGVSKNRAFAAGGATVRKRTDTDVLYLIDEFTTDPVVITNAETVELSYDKRQSVLGEDKNNLIQRIAEEMLYNWLHDQNAGTALPVGSIIRTTGPIAPATAPGATGYRFSASLTDLQAAQTFLINQNRWFDGQMAALYPANMRAQTFPADSIIAATYAQNLTEDERRSGIVAKAQGFNIMTRSTSVILDSAGVIKAPGAAGAAGDCQATLCWYKLAVETAFGEVKMFDQYGNPVYYGDLFSFLARMGGRPRRGGYEGIVLLAQGQPTQGQIDAYLAG